ncbi:serine O-acetyltransferase [Methylicorpusculum sp.]|uniref:serine O-acetyltransferase n=1 Tax=Methylicorpusculum sp. TaxID=2713644 RepID=UPI002ABAAF06|nr:DapH/DapD/GlmU-related protein [Methylicorpusculum sp.]MDZ4154088.1 DapH/DapD/GlmU-related protein [Methylicorpusculum sp.]
MRKLREWFAACKRDWLHSASGTNYCVGDAVPFRSFVIALLTPEFQLVIWYRIYSAIYKNVSRTLGILLYLAIKFIYKCDIHPKCIIGSGFLLVHGFDVVIGPDVVIGQDVVVFNGVNIGKKHVGVIHGAMPTIGDRCVIGTGSKLLGGIVLDENVTVGANAVLMVDAPANSTCVGVPAKVLPARTEKPTTS